MKSRAVRSRRKRSQPADAVFFKKAAGKESSFFESGVSNTFFAPTAKAVQRKCEKCDEEKKMQKKEAGTTSANTSHAASYIHSISSKGVKFPASQSRFFGERMGYDFSHVKLHTGSEAATSAGAI